MTCALLLTLSCFSSVGTHPATDTRRDGCGDGPCIEEGLRARLPHQMASVHIGPTATALLTDLCPLAARHRSTHASVLPQQNHRTLDSWTTAFVGTDGRLATFLPLDSSGTLPLRRILSLPPRRHHNGRLSFFVFRRREDGESHERLNWSHLVSPLSLPTFAEDALRGRPPLHLRRHLRPGGACHKPPGPHVRANILLYCHEPPSAHLRPGADIVFFLQGRHFDSVVSRTGDHLVDDYDLLARHHDASRRLRLIRRRQPTGGRRLGCGLLSRPPRVLPRRNNLHHQHRHAFRHHRVSYPEPLDCPDRPRQSGLLDDGKGWSCRGRVAVPGAFTHTLPSRVCRYYQGRH